MTLRTRLVPWMIALAVLAIAAGVRIADPLPIARVRTSIFDAYQRMMPRVPDPALPVRIVAIDEASLARIGQWPWPRSRMAEIITKLRAAGAKSIGFDLLFAEDDRLSPAQLLGQLSDVDAASPLGMAIAALPSTDIKLADAIRGGPVTVGVTGYAGPSRALPKARASFSSGGDDPLLFVPRFSGGIGSLPPLAEAARGTGAVNWLPSDDQIVRKVPLLFNIDGRLFPALSLEMLRVGDGQSTIFVKSSGASATRAFGQQSGIEAVKTGASILPTDASAELWLHLTGPFPDRIIPAHTVLAPDFDASSVAGRHVLIGATAAGLMDIRATPLEAAVPGVEIHAQALEQMLSGRHVLRPPFATGLELLALAAFGAIVILMVEMAGPSLAAAVGAAIIASLALGSWQAFASAGLLLDPVYPSLAILLAYLASSLPSYVRAEVDRARVRTAFSRYVAPELVDIIAADHDKLKLGGEMREITLLFADVRGFSKIAEGLDAEALVSFINGLFTPFTGIILDERGTIDKYMGDAVMAFWNAPVRDENHARNACRAALRMAAALHGINRSRAEVAAAGGAEHTPIRIGIGLNTGPCCVGNMGSPQRFDYSVLGDPVNIAARLESETKTYGVPIIAGETTRLAAAGFAFLDIGSFTLRGKDRPERLYALVGDEDVASSDAFRDLRKSFAALTGAIRINDRARATSALTACRASPFADLSRLWDSYGDKLSTAA